MIGFTAGYSLGVAVGLAAALLLLTVGGVAAYLFVVLILAFRALRSSR